MKVFVLIKERFSYYDNGTDFEIKIFKDEQSAINYLQIEKEELLLEAMKEIGANTLEELESYAEEGEIVYTFENEECNYYIDIEDWGYDSLRIREYDVMEFKI